MRLAAMAKATDYMMPHSHIIIAHYYFGATGQTLQAAWKPETWYSDPTLKIYCTSYFIVRPKIKAI